MTTLSTARLSLSPSMRALLLLGISSGLVGACASVPSDPTSPGSTSGVTPGTEEEAESQVPHALGSILLGESHQAGGSGQSTPLVSAAFMPDVASMRACKTKLDASCEIQRAAKCTDVADSQTGCGAKEACVFDESCNAVCKAFTVCTKNCSTDEICITSGESAGTCVKTESFDAGPLAFAGTTTPITLFPPYAYKSSGSGAVFLSGSEIRVQAQGTTEAGFEKFDESFTATTFLQTKPALNKIPLPTVFGTSSLPVSWVPGTDLIVLTVSGNGGSVVCKAPDASGTFEIPRTAIDAALGDRKNQGRPFLTLSVARQKKEVRKGKSAKGSLYGVPAQPEGWLELTTTSIENTSFQGCEASTTICADGCADLQSDTQNCGACGKTCGTGQQCQAGKCGTQEQLCNQCIVSADNGACKSTLAACKADVACTKLYNCRAACTTTACISKCDTDNPAGGAKLSPYLSCLRSACSSTCN
jgi:hypothetical protein